MIVIRKTDATIARVLPTISVRPDVLYIPSQFALPFEHNGKRYCFNNLTKQCIEGELPKEARAGEGYDDLITAHFLVPDDRDECAYYNSISAAFRKLPVSATVINTSALIFSIRRSSDPGF